MTQELTNQDFVTKELAKYNLADERIAELSKKYMPIVVKDPKDRMNYDICKIAHRDMVVLRTGVEKIRKNLKSSSLDFGRKVDAEAKRITTKLLDIENHLMTQRKVVEAELARIAKEKEDAIKAEEERKIREEEERLEQIRLEQEEKQRELDEKEERLQLEQEAIEAEKALIEAEKQAAIEKEKQDNINRLYKERTAIAIKYADFWEDEYTFGLMSKKAFELLIKNLKLAKESFEKDAEAKRKIEEHQKIAEEKAETERQEALKPDIEKLCELSKKLSAIEMPKVKSEAAITLLFKVSDAICSICEDLENAKL